MAGDLMLSKVQQAYNVMDARAKVVHEPGVRVTVGPAYRGQGEFAPDGYEGVWIVKDRCGPIGGRVDYHLINDAGTREVYMPASRISTEEGKP